MQTPQRSGSYSILGKRPHNQDLHSTSKRGGQLQTPESIPKLKRARTSTSLLDGDGNKENVPPLKLDGVNAEGSSASASRPTRGLRRTNTEFITPTRSRPTPRRHASMSLIYPTPSKTMASVSALFPASIISKPLFSMATPPASPRTPFKVAASESTSLNLTSDDDTADAASDCYRAEFEIIRKFAEDDIFSASTAILCAEKVVPCASVSDAETVSGEAWIPTTDLPMMAAAILNLDDFDGKFNY